MIINNLFEVNDTVFIKGSVWNDFEPTEHKVEAIMPIVESGETIIEYRCSTVPEDGVSKVYAEDELHIDKDFALMNEDDKKELLSHYEAQLKQATIHVENFTSRVAELTKKLANLKQ